MKAKELKAKMDREVEIRKLVAKLDRESSEQQIIINKLFNAVYDTTTSSCTVELTDTEQEEAEMMQSGFEPAICFVCKEELFPHHGEIIFRADGKAHMDCLWKVAVISVYGGLIEPAGEMDKKEECCNDRKC